MSEQCFGCTAAGAGIYMITNANEPGELDKVRLLEKQGQIYVAKDMLAAAEYIVARAGKKSGPPAYRP